MSHPFPDESLPWKIELFQGKGDTLDLIIKRSDMQMVSTLDVNQVETLHNGLARWLASRKLGNHNIN